MTTSFRAGMVSAVAALCSLLLLLPEPGQSQAPLDDQAKAAAKAALVKATAETKMGLLTLFDRRGKVLRTLSDRANYSDLTMSPDGMRLAVNKIDDTAQSAVWVFDLGTGAGTPLTSGSVATTSAVWSPDGSQIVYLTGQAGSFGLYRIAANGTGSAELLYRPPDNSVVTSWSPDGRFILFSAGNPGRLYVLPLNAAAPGDRKAIEVVRQGQLGRFSPDGRFLSYVSNQSGRPEIWVQPFDPSAPEGVAPASGPWRISDRGSQSWLNWRQDGKEAYFVAADGQTMAVEVTQAPSFRSGKPRPLFRAPNLGPRGLGVSGDGQQLWFFVPRPRRGEPFPNQITVFDRQGKLVRKLKESADEPMLSPDGMRLAAISDYDSIRVFDLSSGNSTRVVTGTSRYHSSPVWSQDGSKISFFSYRRSVGAVYRIPSNGTGREELLFTHEAGLYSPPLTDWSPDGRFLSFFTGGVPWVLPLNGERKAVELMHEIEYAIYGLRFSPDSRFVAYVSEESGRKEVYVRPFDSARLTLGEAKWQVSPNGGLGLVTWRKDGKELLYLAQDGGVMAMDVTTTPAFRAGTPHLLFRAPAGFPLVGISGREGVNDPDCSESNPSTCEQGSISRDGQRFAFNIPVPPRRTEVTIAPGIVSQYVGVYSGGVVTLEGNQLMVQPTGRKKVALFAESETTFFMKATYGEFEFARDPSGVVKYLFFYRGDVGGGVPRQWIRQ